MINIEYLDKECLDTINRIVSHNPLFSEQKFIDWLRVKKIQEKANPSKYVLSCFEREYQSGRFNDERPQRTPTKKGVVMVQPIFNAMREHGIEVIPNDTLKIDVMLNKLVNDLEIDPTELTSLNHLLIDTPLISNTTEYIAKLIENYPEVEKHD